MVREYTLGQEQYPDVPKQQTVIIYDPATGQPMFKTTVPPPRQEQPRQVPRGFTELITRPVMIAAGETEWVKGWDIAHPRLSDIIYQQAAKIKQEKTPIPIPAPSPAPMWFLVGGLTEAFEPSPSYAPRPKEIQREVGKFVGTSAIIGLTVGAAVQEFIQQRAASYLGKKYLEKGPLNWKGRTERLIMKLTGAEPQMAPGIVDIPEFAKPTIHGLYAQEKAWALAEAPKTSAYLVTKYTGPTGKMASAWVMEHWLKTVSGGLSYTLISQELEAVKPISNSLRKSAMPPIPTVEPFKGTPLVPFLFGIPASVIKPSDVQKQISQPLTVPKAYEDLITLPKIKPLEMGETDVFLKIKPSLKALPVVAPITKPAISPIGETDVFLKVRTEPIMKVSPIQEAKAIQKQLQKQMQTQKQTQGQLQMMIQRYKPRYYEEAKKLKRRKKKKIPIGLFGRYTVDYPIATPQQIIETLLG